MNINDIYMKLRGGRCTELLEKTSR